MPGKNQEVESVKKKNGLEKGIAGYQRQTNGMKMPHNHSKSTST